MRAFGFFHNFIKKSRINLDQRIIRTFSLCAQAAIEHSCSSLVALGRGLNSHAKTKNNIKRVDRLLRNKVLQAQRPDLYKPLALQAVKENTKPIILVDWSGLTPCGEYHLLRAAVPFKHRSLTIYEEVYPEKLYGSQKAHQSFLKHLKDLLPATCKPTIVTDAGFRCPWLKCVSKYGWNFITRVRHNTLCQPPNKSEWITCKSLYKKAKTRAKHLGKFLLSKQKAMECELYLFKDKKKSRVKKNIKGKRVKCSSCEKHAKSGREPWLLATSLNSPQYTAQKIVAIYRLRMQIEQGFRDMKNTRNGLAFRHSRTRKADRLGVLLLIIAYALFYIMLLGCWGKEQAHHYDLQTNTITKRSVLSVTSIGFILFRTLSPPSPTSLLKFMESDS